MLIFAKVIVFLLYHLINLPQFAFKEKVAQTSRMYDDAAGSKLTGLRRCEVMELNSLSVWANTIPVRVHTFSVFMST